MHRYWETLIRPTLSMIHVKDILEIGTESGKNTNNLLGYCRENNATLYSVDPVPGFDVESFKREGGGHFQFFQSLSLNAIPLVDRFDLVLIDGDHNWYTVYHELKLIEKKCKTKQINFPLIFLHDIGWPYARRDLYYNPDNIPGAFRKPYRKKGIAPHSPDLLEKGGLNPDMFNALYENDFQNGVLTAVEDFLDETQYQLELIKLPGLYGFGVITSSQMVSDFPELRKFLDQFLLGDSAASHVENVEIDRINKQMLVNEKRGEISILNGLRKKEKEAKQQIDTHARLLKNEIQSQQHKIQALEKDRIGFQNEIQSQQHKIQALEKDSIGFQNEIQELEKDRIGFQNEIQSQQHKIQELEKDRIGFQNEIQSQQHKIQDLEKVRIGFQHEIQSLKNNKISHVKQIDFLSASVEQLKYGILTLLESRRWKLAISLGELFRKVRFRPKSPMVEDYLGRVFQDISDWEKKSKKEKKDRPDDIHPPVHPQIEKKIFNPFHSNLYLEQKTVDVVVCVYNALRDVEKCLTSVVEKTICRFNLIIVNDGSDQETTNFLHTFSVLHSNCCLINNAEPHGYTVAANQGLKASKADYIVLLNSDTIVPSFWLKRILECGESDPGIGIIGPLSNAASWQSIPELYDSKGDWAVNELPVNTTVEDMAKLVARMSCKDFPRVPFVNGFCFAVKREVVNKIGYLDEVAFPKGYGEENDFCLRAAEAGFSLAIADHTYVYHAKSKSYSHERRLELAAKGGRALKEKYPLKNISDLTKRLKADPVLKKMRRLLGNHSNELNNSFRSKILIRVLFVLPVMGGGGGAHSVVQEAFGMRKLGFDAQVAIPKLYMHEFKRNYSSLMDQEENLFLIYEEKDLNSHAKKFNVVVGTVNHSVQFIKNIVTANPSILPAYYVQDYEPLFYENGSKEWQIAYDSYSLVSGMVLMAKTKWLCDIVHEKHGLQVEKVCPSIDRSVYFPGTTKTSSNGPIMISAMVRPSSPRRNPRLTMEVLKLLQIRYRDAVDIRIFGCKDDDHGFLELDRDFPYKNHGVLTREKVASLLRQSDVFVDFSTYQAFGRTGLEAMACGCAVILPLKGGVHEYAIHGENALIVDTGSREECYNALDRMVEDDMLRSKLIDRALLKATEYSISRSVVSEIDMLTEQWNKRFLSRNIPKVDRKGKIRLHSLIACSDVSYAPGSYYIRHYQPFTHPLFLDKFDFTAVNMDEVFNLDTDILVVPRVTLAGEKIAYKLLDHCQKNGIKTVYETDDNLFDLPLNHLESAKYKTAMPAAKLFAENADLIITSSDRLKENLMMYNDNIQVIPNALDERLWQPFPTPINIKNIQIKPQVRILYMGTYTHLNDLLIVEEAMKKILDKWGDKVAFDVIGITKGQNNLEWVNTIKIPSSNYKKFVKWLCKKSCWSIGIAPLEDTEFNNCKSYIKYLDYAALGAVPVCSNILPYQSVVQTGKNGILTDNDTDSWYGALNSLIEDELYRVELATNAYQCFLERHTLRTEIKKWVDAFHIPY